MGIRIGYLSNADQTLRIGRRIFVTVVVELCCVKGDTRHSNQAPLQDVFDVRIPEHWGDGTVRPVCPITLRLLLFYILFHRLIPETKGRTLEEMDIIFGTINAEDRAKNIARQEHEISNAGI